MKLKFLGILNFDGMPRELVAFHRPRSYGQFVLIPVQDTKNMYFYGSILYVRTYVLTYSTEERKTVAGNAIPRHSTRVFCFPPDIRIPIHPARTIPHRGCRTLASSDRIMPYEKCLSFGNVI